MLGVCHELSDGVRSDKSVSEAGPEAQPDGYADDDEFRSAYEVEKPRWADLAERLK